MSILGEFEEISLSDNSTENTEEMLRRQKSPKEISIAERLKKLKSNPDTFDYQYLLNQMKRPAKFSSNSPPVVERMLFNHQLSMNKKRFLIQQKECDEVKSCTFRPKIKSQHKRRSFKDFYSSQQQFLNNKNARLQSLRENQKKSEDLLDVERKNKLEISPGSRQILKKIEERNPEFFKEDASYLCKTVSLSKGIFKALGRPPLPKSPVN
ncbi:hypothetical protein SteCoe_10719 [Stentor coeruleus]|uniref:Uncharacterized protein n=1 Tax=Stentor coeruleus TaxID=5963 RepID=A0A1R2CEU0_9CILI|nr:hypothetical protein SteCoe_10719 [Stentor coeruleus]